jgi:hypothetical protein
MTSHRSPRGHVALHGDGSTETIVKRSSGTHAADPLFRALDNLRLFAAHHFPECWDHQAMKEVGQADASGELIVSDVGWLRIPDLNHLKRILEEEAEATPRWIAARYVLTIIKAQSHLIDFLEADDLDGSRRAARMAMQTLLELEAYGRSLSVVENELAIDDRQKSIEKGKEGGQAKADAYRDRNIYMASEYERRRRTSVAMSDTALKADIGAKLPARFGPPIGRRAAIDAVNRGLEILRRTRGKPHAG